MRNSLYPIFFSLVFLMAACAGSSEPAEGNSDKSDKEENTSSSQNKIPDAVVKIQIKKDGSIQEELNFTLEGQKATTQAATCSYQKASHLFSMLLNGNLTSAGSKVSLSGGIPELKEGRYEVKPMDPNKLMEQLFCTYTNSASTPYVSQEGFFEITDLSLFQDIGVAAATYFMNARLNIRMVSQADPSDVISLEGTVEGINTVTR